MSIDLADLNEDEFKARFMAMTPTERRETLAIINSQYTRFEDASPSNLATRLDSKMIVTPALQLISDHLVQVRDAVEVMYLRRERLAKLIREGIDQKIAIERVSRDIPAKGITRLIISLAPQEGKSSLVSRYNVEWLLRQFPALRIALVSYDGVNASQFSYQVRGDIELFNGLSEPIDLGLRLIHDEKAKSRWSLVTGGGIFAIGIGGGLTGRPVDFMLIDDPVKDYQAADSEIRSEVAWDWWQTVGSPRLAPWAPVVIVSTRWHEYDLPGRLILKQEEDESSGVKNYDKWTVLNIPAEADHDPLNGEKDVLGRKPGEFIISARGRTDDDWLKIKNNTDARFWSAMYQGRPSPETGTVFLKEWWGRDYDEVLWTQVEDGTFRVHGYELTQSWDMAFKDTKSSDYVVGQLWAKKGADSYLIYQLRARLTFVKTLDAMRRMSRLFPQARMKLVEDKANGTAVISALKHEIAGIVAINPDQSKEARGRAVSFVVRAGNVHLPTSRVANAISELAWSPGDFVLEATAFPNGAHDDQVDALTQYLKVKYLEGGEATIMTPTSMNRKKSAPSVTLSPTQKKLLAKASGEA